MPEYTMPMLSQTMATFSIEESSMSVEADFFSVAMTTPLVAKLIEVEG
jgi:hypothetical protein